MNINLNFVTIKLCLVVWESLSMSYAAFGSVAFYRKRRIWSFLEQRISKNNISKITVLIYLSIVWSTLKSNWSIYCCFNITLSRLNLIGVWLQYRMKKKKKNPIHAKSLLLDVVMHREYRTSIIWHYYFRPIKGKDISMHNPKCGLPTPCLTTPNAYTLCTHDYYNLIQIISYAITYKQRKLSFFLFVLRFKA